MEKAEYLYRSQDWKVNELCAIIEAYEDLVHLPDALAIIRLVSVLDHNNWKVPRLTPAEAKNGQWLVQMTIRESFDSWTTENLLVRSTDHIRVIKVMVAIVRHHRGTLGMLENGALS